MDVWLVCVVYQYDGYADTEVYETVEKANDAANQLLLDFQYDGYEINSDFSDVKRFDESCGDMAYVCLGNGNIIGHVEISRERKQVR